MQYALILAHLVGDYPLQSHTMALKKTSDGRWAAVHALFYGVPFVVILLYGAVTGQWTLDQAYAAWVVIVGTHAVIDRYALARRWCIWYGVGHPGMWWTEADRNKWKDHRNYCPWTPGGNSVWQEEARYETRNEVFEYPPQVLGMVLQILVDNTLHMLVNGACFWWLQG